ncbi:thiol-activated cytolysin family protein [Chitinophaga sp. CC14]|uniref:thiol-activated cytolysin family protein n=1 Tax=Chitinophaga sp. CC14 TaxID=3029199 RepID=UPI003B77E5E8
MFPFRRLLIYAMVPVLLSGCMKEQAKRAGEKKGRYSFSHLPDFPVTPFSVKGKAPDSLLPGITAAAILNARKSLGDIDVPGKESVTPRGPEFRDIVNTTTYTYAQLFDANEFVVNTTNSNTVYPGSIIKGSSIEAFTLNPVLGYGRPVTVSVSIPTSPVKVSRTLPLASPSGMFQMVREALTTDFAGAAGASRLNFEMKSFSYYQELKTLYGYNSKSNLLFVSNVTSGDKDLAKISRTTGIMVKFLQQNFTVDMDLPEDGQLIDRNVDPAVFDGYAPLYVSSVTYGRLGIMTIETNAEQARAEEVFRKAFSVLGIVNGGNSLTSEEQALIDASEIKVSVAGVPGEEGVQLVMGVQGLSALLAKGMTYTAQTPGVPIVFKMRKVEDDANFAAPFQVNYGIYNKVYASIEIENQRQTGNNGAGATYNIGDVYLAFYQWPNKVQPVAAENFIALDYLVNTVSVNRQYGPDGYYNRTDRNEDFTIKNASKNTRLLLKKDATLSYHARYYDPNMPNNGSESQSDYTFRLKPGSGYLIQL